jgi:YD repeat-containing protein
MRLLVTLLLLALLAACVPEYVQPEEKAIQQPAKKPAAVVPYERFIPEPAAVVLERRGNRTLQWGFDSEGRLVMLNGTETLVGFQYKDNRLALIDDGERPVRFFYDRNRLLSVEKGVSRWQLTYSSKGGLLSMENREKLTVTHDSKGRLSSVKRDGGPTTEFVYDDQNRTKSMFRDKAETALHYDDNGRLTLMTRGSDHLVIGYWRYDLLSSLSGTMYGLKETVNYGPTAITLVSNVEQSEFSGGDEALRLKAFNTFLFCTRFRSLPVLFDGVSWVLYREYMKGNITDYLQTTFVCDALP